MVKACLFHRMMRMWNRPRTRRLHGLASGVGPRWGAGVALREFATGGQAVSRELEVRWRAGHSVPMPDCGGVSLFCQAGPRSPIQPRFSTRLPGWRRRGDRPGGSRSWMKRFGRAPVCGKRGSTAARYISENRTPHGPRSRISRRRFGWRPTNRTSISSAATSSPACQLLHDSVPSSFHCVRAFSRAHRTGN
jgi:hypothetical protein